MIKSSMLSFVFTLIACSTFAEGALKLAVAGLSHGHVDWIFNRKNKDDVQLVGIYETNTALIDRYAKQYGISKNMFFTDLGKMLDEVKPDAVSAFGAVSEHVLVVRACAPRNIHVMVEKPLASTLEDAVEIEQLAEKHHVHVLTNFETSWYESNQQVKSLLDANKLGDIRKVMVNDGHEGPKEIGVSKEFFEILTDPAKNGAGALVDFGCYGANLMTWLMKGEKPLSVTAVSHQNKPDIYKNVDDEASIILQYSGVQCIIQASWNWPFSRKDMELYGTKGYAIAAEATTLRYRLQNQQSEKTEKLAKRKAPFDDPFSVLSAVVKGKLILDEFDCYGLPANVITVAILDAARKSAADHKTIYLSQ
ncbi:Gfo/Idh/MocA family protein [Sphingobacterium paludis]|nr:Gfo/Idh/MocA family oxidoreductase [Sphingobacterium paludis]